MKGMKCDEGDALIVARCLRVYASKPARPHEYPLHHSSSPSFGFKKTVAHRTEVAGQRLRPRAPKGFAADAEGTPD
jgi:hypothetical protein